MSLETSPIIGTRKPERKHYDRTKSDDLQISRTDMNMLIMNYLVTGTVIIISRHFSNKYNQEIKNPNVNIKQ